MHIHTRQVTVRSQEPRFQHRDPCPAPATPPPEPPEEKDDAED